MQTHRHVAKLSSLFETNGSLEMETTWLRNGRHDYSQLFKNFQDKTSLFRPMNYVCRLKSRKWTDRNASARIPHAEKYILTQIRNISHI